MDQSNDSLLVPTDLSFESLETVNGFSFVDFGDYFDQISIFFRGVIYSCVILPPKKDRNLVKRTPKSTETESVNSLLKKFNQHGVEYWSARDLQPGLGYSHWRDFKNAIKKGIKSCEQSENDPQHHFADVRKPIPGGKGSLQMVEDYHLSRFACYLIAQNGDPRKRECLDPQSSMHYLKKGIQL